MPCKYLNIWHPFGVVQWYRIEVTLNINNHNSVVWNIRGVSKLCWHQWIHCMNRISKYTLTKIHPPTMSNVSFTIHTCTPLQRTLHHTCPTISDTYCIGTLTCNINPTIPQNIMQKFPAQFVGTDTSTAFDQCGILFIPTHPVNYFPKSISLSKSMVPPTGPAHSVPSVLAISPTATITTISLALPCLLTGCVQSFVIDLPTCPNWTNYLHHTDPTHLLLGIQLMTVLW